MELLLDFYLDSRIPTIASNLAWPCPERHWSDAPSSRHRTTPAPALPARDLPPRLDRWSRFSPQSPSPTL